MTFYFATGSPGTTRAAMEAGLIGQIIQPFGGYARLHYWGHTEPASIRWCADNGCYGKSFDLDKWWQWMHDTDPTGAEFAAAPDVFSDAAATLARSAPWLPRMRELGWPVAYVGQDGQQNSPIPWDELDVLFLGGTNTWKFGEVGRRVIAEALRRDKRVHMGRVNSLKRMRWCEAHGVHTADGTHITFKPRERLAQVLQWGTDQIDRPALFDFVEEVP